MKRLGLFSLIIAIMSAGSMAAHPAESSEETIVFVVRHAEKASDDRDPVLSEAGTARASALARLLADAGIEKIFTTQYQRTRLTAAPLAQAGRIEADVVEATATHAEDLASRIRSSHRGGRLLIVGHSNTVPAILGALGVPDPPPLTDADYDRLYIVTLSQDGRAGLITLRYGE